MPGTVCTSARAYFDCMTSLLATIDPEPIDAFADLLYEARRDDKRVFIFGNGGSAYNASHHVTDLVKTASVDGGKRLQAFSLVDNYGMTTALANDVGYEDTFIFPLESYARPGDIAVAISCSGNSPNIVKACRWAKEHGLTLVALSGFQGGKMAQYADIHINVPHDNYGIIEDLHLSVGHIVTQCIYERVKAQRSGV